MLDKKVAALKQEIAVLDERLRYLSRFREFLASPGFQEMLGPLIDTEIGGLQRHLERIDLKPGETTLVRGKLVAYRHIRTLHDSCLREMEQIADKAAGLQRQFEEWHDRGVPDVKAAQETAARVAGPKPRTRKRR